MKISLHIFNLLRDHDCVIVPNFGALVCRNISAKISSDKTKIYPPNKEISFNRSLVKNDGLLINHISYSEKLSYEKAEKKIANWVNKNLKKLENQEMIEVKNIGSIHLKNAKFILQGQLKNLLNLHFHFLKIMNLRCFTGNNAIKFD